MPPLDIGGAIHAFRRCAIDDTEHSPALFRLSND